MPERNKEVSILFLNLSLERYSTKGPENLLLKENDTADS
jgi:hypothetical protein